MELGPIMESHDYEHGRKGPSSSWPFPARAKGPGTLARVKTKGKDHMPRHLALSHPMRFRPPLSYISTACTLQQSIKNQMGKNK